MLEGSWPNTYCEGDWAVFEHNFLSPCFAGSIDAIIPVSLLLLFLPLYIAKLYRVRLRALKHINLLCQVQHCPEVSSTQGLFSTNQEWPVEGRDRTTSDGVTAPLLTDNHIMTCIRPSSTVWSRCAIAVAVLASLMSASTLGIDMYNAQWVIPSYSRLTHALCHLLFYWGMIPLILKRSITPLPLSVHFNGHLYLLIGPVILSHICYPIALMASHAEGYRIYVHLSILVCLLLILSMTAIHCLTYWQEIKAFVVSMTNIGLNASRKTRLWALLRKEYAMHMHHGTADDGEVSQTPNSKDLHLPFVLNASTTASQAPAVTTSSPHGKSATDIIQQPQIQPELSATKDLLSSLHDNHGDYGDAAGNDATDDPSQSWVDFKKAVFYPSDDAGYSYFESDDVYQQPPDYSAFAPSLCPRLPIGDSMSDLLKYIERHHWHTLQRLYTSDGIPIPGSSSSSLPTLLFPDAYQRSSLMVHGGDSEDDHHRQTTAMDEYLFRGFTSHSIEPTTPLPAVAELGCRTPFQKQYLLPGALKSPMRHLVWPWEVTTNAFATLTFGWITPLLKYGYKHVIEMGDLDPPAPYTSTSRILSHFDFFWKKRLADQQIPPVAVDSETTPPSSTTPRSDLLALGEITTQRAASSPPSQQQEQSNIKAKSADSVLPAVLDDLPGQRYTHYSAASMFWMFWEITGRRVLFGSFCKLTGDIFGYLPPILMNALLNFASDPSTAPFWGGYRGAYGYMLGLMLVLSNWFQNVLLQHSYHFMIREAARARSLTMAVVFRKLVTLDPLFRRTLGGGMINNIITTDSQRVDNVYWMGYYIIFAPIQCGITILLLVNYLGLSAFVGVGILLLTLPTQLLMSRISSKLTARNQTITDSRVSSLLELLSGMKTIKSHAWEPDFLTLLSSIRQAECRALLIRQVWNGLQAMLLQSAPSIVATATFFTYAKTDHLLTPSIAFTALALFNMLQTTLWSLPWTVQYIVEFRVALIRLAAFLSLPDKHMQATPCAYSIREHNDAPNVRGDTDGDQWNSSNPIWNGELAYATNNGDNTMSPLRPIATLTLRETSLQDIPIGEIRIINTDFWTTSYTSSLTTCATLQAGASKVTVPLPSLHIPRLVCPAGSLTCIVGPVGSGKSFLLSCLLGNIPSTPSLSATISNMLRLYTDPSTTTSQREMIIHQLAKLPLVSPTSTGAFMHPFSGVCYVPQVPWITSGTVRENIILDAPYIPALFDEAVAACALSDDLDMMPARDLTVIGERGSTLSGGQKQRINLCRAVYRRHLSSIFIFDSPLSALDGHVAEHVYHQVLGPNGLLKDKTRIMVTHQLQWCQQCDQLLSMQSSLNISPLELSSNGVEYEYGSLSVRIVEAGTFEELVAVTPVTPHDVLELTTPLSETAVTKDVASTEAATQHSNPLVAYTMQSFPPYQPFAHLYEVYTTQSAVVDDDDEEEEADRVTRVNKDHPTHHHSTHQEQERLTLPGSFTEQDAYQPSSLSSAVALSIGSAQLEGPSSFQLSNSASATLIPSASSMSASSSFQQHVASDQQQAPASSEGVEIEHRAKGEVPWSIYGSYLLNIGLLLSIICLFVCVAQVAIARYTDYWLTQWSSDKLHRDAMFYIKIYAYLQLSTIASNFIAGVMWAVAGVQASKRIHRSMLTSIMYTAMSFFDTTPLGRIINRFNGDISSIDSTLPVSFSTWLSLYLQIISFIVMMGIQMPALVPVFIPLAIIFAYISRYFRASCRELRRLEAISKSPIFIHVDHTIDGSECIDIYRQHLGCLTHLFNVMDEHWKPRYLGQCLNRWLAFRLDFLGNIILLVVIGVSLTVGKSPAGNSNDSSLLGLVLGYALTMTSKVNWLVRTSVDTENQMNSVDRCLEYSSLPPEAAGNPFQALDGNAASYAQQNPSLPSSAVIRTMPPKSGKAGPNTSLVCVQQLEQTRHLVFDQYKPCVKTDYATDLVTPLYVKHQTELHRAYLAQGGVISFGYARSWPNPPAIWLSNIQARYRPGLPLVVDNISCNIDPGSKVAVVGRTGAGKSSLVALLLRLVETEQAISHQNAMLALAAGEPVEEDYQLSTLSPYQDSNLHTAMDSDAQDVYTMASINNYHTYTDATTTNTSDSLIGNHSSISQPLLETLPGQGDSNIDIQSGRVIKSGIMIDGIDIAALPLSFLRQNLCIIPQDPVLFSQTLRFNIAPSLESVRRFGLRSQYIQPMTPAYIPVSPLSQHPNSPHASPVELGATTEDLLSDPIDGVLWDALDKVGLLPIVSTLPGGLDYTLKSSTDVFSHGQRQLFCLARALLKGSRIILLDEATSSVDLSTETMMNDVINRCFHGRTIIAIAHHVHTVIDYDTVIVMDAGKIAEIGNPRQLLQLPTSLFKSLVFSSSAATPQNSRAPSSHQNTSSI